MDVWWKEHFGGSAGLQAREKAHHDSGLLALEFLDTACSARNSNEAVG
jgi:hypothetical protein